MIDNGAPREAHPGILGTFVVVGEGAAGDATGHVSGPNVSCPASLARVDPCAANEMSYAAMFGGSRGGSVQLIIQWKNSG
jgi:hypothetical protein